MSSLFAIETVIQSPNESKLRRIDFTSILASGETLTGTPTVTISPSGPTLSEKAVNAATYVNQAGVTVGVGKAVVVRVAGVEVNTKYIITAYCGSSLNNIHDGRCRLNGVNE